MIGKVIEGRYAGASVNKLPDKNVLFIQTEEGERIALSKKNAISIEDISMQYPSSSGKVMMVLWNDFETSVFQFNQKTNKNVSKDSTDKSKNGKPSKERKRNLKKPVICVCAIILTVFTVLILNKILSNKSNILPDNRKDNYQVIETIDVSLSTDINIETTDSNISDVEVAPPEEGYPETASENVALLLETEVLQYPTQDENWKYDVYNTFVAIHSYVGESHVATIPSEVDGLPVRVITKNLSDGSHFSEITIPQSVVYIDDYAFYGLPIQQVHFENDNLIVFGKGVFSCCTELVDVDNIIAHIEGSRIPVDMFAAEIRPLPGNSGFDRNSEKRCNLDESITLPDRITTIDTGAFRGQQNLKSINLGNIEKIGNAAFYDCNNLESATLDNLVSIGKNAFDSCYGLKNITLYNINEIPKQTFYKCINMTVIDVGIAASIGEEALPQHIIELYVRNSKCEFSVLSFDNFFYRTEETMYIYGLSGSTAAKFASEQSFIFKPI